jgi:hypothetical protein
MLNGNPDNFFLMPYRDRRTGRPKYAKAFACTDVMRVKNSPLFELARFLVC